MNASEGLFVPLLILTSSLLASTVTNPLSTILTPSLKTTSRKSWKSNARCLTTMTPGSTSAFISSRRRDTPSSPWTSSRWKNWTARYKLHYDTLPYTRISCLPPGTQSTHPPSLLPLSVKKYQFQCCWNPTCLSLQLVCVSLRFGDPRFFLFCWELDSKCPERIKGLHTLPVQCIGFQKKAKWVF